MKTNRWMLAVGCAAAEGPLRHLEDAEDRRGAGAAARESHCSRLPHGQPAGQADQVSLNRGRIDNVTTNNMVFFGKWEDSRQH